MKCCCNKLSQNTLGSHSVEDESDDRDEFCRSAASVTTGGEVPYLWYPSTSSVKHDDYVKKLECEIGCLQKAFLALTTQFARMQFRLRQILQATPEERDELLRDLERIAFQNTGDMEECDELPRIQRDLRSMGDVRRKQNCILEKLRSQMTALSEAADAEGNDITLELEKLTEECRRNANANANGNGNGHGHGNGYGNGHGNGNGNGNGHGNGNGNGHGNGNGNGRANGNGNGYGNVYGGGIGKEGILAKGRTDRSAKPANCFGLVKNNNYQPEERERERERRRLSTSPSSSRGASKTNLRKDRGK